MKKEIVFDIGGVLFELDLKNSIPKLLNSTEENGELLFQQWLFSKSVREFESGKISYEDFFKNMVKEFNLKVDFETFTNEFKKVILGAFDETEWLINTLKDDYNLYLLSNITKIHWDMVNSYDYIKKNIKKPFISYLLGMAKPEIEIFELMIKEIGVKPENILYFDDNLSNVESALKSGLDAYHTIGIKEVIKKLKELKIL